jgi:hypothetical protein
MTTTVSTRTSGTLNPTRQQLDELDALLKRMLELPVNQLDDSDAAEEPPPPIPVIPVIPVMEPMRATLPVSYMVVETASPRPLPQASGFEPSPAVPSMRLMPVESAEESSIEEESEPFAPPAETGEAEMWVPLRSTWQPSAQTWQPLAESWQHANGSAPTPVVVHDPIPAPNLNFVPQREIAPQPRVEPPEQAPMPKPVEKAVAPAAPAPAEKTIPFAPASSAPRLSLSPEDAPVSAPIALLPLVWFNQGFDACLEPLGAPGRWLSGRGGRQTLGVVGLLCLAAATVIAVSAGMGWSW